MSANGRGAGTVLPLLILAAAVASAVFLVPVAQTLRFDASADALVPERNGSRLLGATRASIFRNPDVAVHIKGMAVPATELDRWAKSLANLDGVREASALAPDRGAEDATAKRRPSIHLTLQRASNLELVDAHLRDLLADRPGSSYELTGPAVTESRVSTQLESAVRDYTLVAAAIAFLVAVLCLRSATGALLTLLCVGIGFVWSLAAIAATGRPITVPTAGIIPLLPVVGVAFPLYVLARIQNDGDPTTRSSDDAGSFQHLRRRLGVLAAAPLVGAMVHLASAFPAIRDFGLFASLGVVGMAGSVLLLAPDGVAAWLGRRGPAIPNETALRHSRRIESLGALAVRRGWALAAFAFALTAAAVVGMWRFSDVSDFGAILGNNGDSSTATSDHLRTWNVRVGGRQANSIDRLETIFAIADLQRFVAAQPSVVSTYSLLDIVAERRSGSSEYELPATQAEVDARLEIEHDKIAHLVNRELSTTRILVQTAEIDSAKFNTLRDRIEAFSRPSGWSRLLGRRARFPAGVAVSARGVLVDQHRFAPRLQWEVVRSLAITSTVLIALLSIQFLSGRIGFLVVFLNLLSIVVVIGIAAWTRVGNNSVTAALPSFLLGLAIGHTAYYFRALGADGRTLDCPTEALTRIVQSAGRPLTYAVLALLLVFCAMATTEIPALRWFSSIGATGLLLAFLANLLLLSSRVLNARVITMADFLNTRLGAVEEIPLFSGMRPFQAKLVVLNGRLAKAATGTAIARQGESSSELYLMLGGKADVRHGEDGPVLGTVQRGDVVGEMGLLREAPRSADVFATEPVEFLILDGDLLERLRRQYPRTAAVLLYNLTRILSDRLDRATERITALQAGI